MQKATFIVLLAALVGMTGVAPVLAAAPAAHRVFRAPRHTRGNTNLLRVQPIDEASWVWSPKDERTVDFLKFRRAFEVKEGDGKLVFDVSADERFYLTLDGAFVARGPNRSTVENWQYQTYEVELAPGEHVFEATVWKIGESGPLAQLSWRGGFIFKAEGVYDARLTTGKADWQVGRLSGLKPAGKANHAWGTGDQWEVFGRGAEAGVPDVWQTAAVVRGPAGVVGPHTWGLRTKGWMLFPAQLPDQTETVVRPGRIVAVAEDVPWCGRHDYTAADTRHELTNALNVPLRTEGGRVTVPAHRRVQAAWDLGRYICAYPVLTMKGAKGARVSWTWSESALRATDNLKGAEPGARDAIVGRYLNGFGDTFVCDGEREGTFTVPWFRCGKWCRLDIETGDEPLEISDLHLIESRYPVELEGEFSSPDDGSLPDIRRICARAMQMCCHEMLFDCPYYEQQMYPGDTRVQLNVLTAFSRDDRMIRRAIELYDLSSRDDGQCPFNWPTRGTQEGATYTLCYLLMYGDYVMNHDDRAWLKARLPGFRRTLAGMELYENEQGLLENLPGWSFMDWVPEWRSGVAPDGRTGEGVSSLANLLWLMDMQAAEKVETVFGNPEQAAYWHRKGENLKRAIRAAFWSAERSLVADTVRKDDFSEHAQALALLADLLPSEEADEVFRHLIGDADLKRCTVYFSYYLFEAYFKYGRGDLFLKRLDLWRDYVKKGLTTTQEAPDTGENGKDESRSDCHAWGAHPIWFMQTGLAGIRSAAPFFEKVRIAPSPGGLKSLHAKHPHPKGWITVDLTFDGNTAKGTIDTPVAGDFVFGDTVITLPAGRISSF